MVDFESLRTKLDDVPKVNGISPMDVLDLPDPLGGIIRRMIREKSMSLPEFAEALDLPSSQAEMIGERMVQKGYFEKEEHEIVIYKVKYAQKRKRFIPEF
jgi:hypothetical protein